MGEETEAKSGLFEEKVEKHTLLCKSPILYSRIYKSIFYLPRLSHVKLKHWISRKSPLLLLHIRRVSMESASFLRSLNCKHSFLSVFRFFLLFLAYMHVFLCIRVIDYLVILLLLQIFSYFWFFLPYFLVCRSVKT